MYLSSLLFPLQTIHIGTSFIGLSITMQNPNYITTIMPIKYTTIMCIFQVRSMEFMVEIRINATFLNCRRELRFPTAPKFCRDSEIAPTECDRF